MHKKPFLILCALCLFVCGQTRAGQYTTTVKSEKGERWWGVFVGKAPVGPFVEPFKVNTASAEAGGRLSPMLVSSLGRYVWSDTPLDIAFDGTDFTISSDAAPVEVQKGGRTLREAYLVCCHKHCPPQGESLATQYAFDFPYYETRLEFGLSHSAQSVLDYAQKLLQEGFPKGVIVLSDGWARSNGSFDFDPEFYPDPKAFVDGLHALGFKVMLTVTPLVGASGRSYVAAVRENELILGNNGRPLVVRGAEGFQVCYDLKSEKVMEKLGSGIARLRDNYGVDGLRLDCSGVLPHLAADEREAFCRSWSSLGAGIPLSQYVPVTGPVHSGQVMCLEELFDGYGSLRNALNDMLMAGLCGYPSCDVSWTGDHFSDVNKDKLVMARALQLSLMSPFVNVPFAPWRVEDPALYEQVKASLRCRMAATDYIRELAAEADRTAEPMVRHMEYMFPRSGFSDCNDQFMIGTRYLVAPMLNADEQRTVRLPRGVWVDAQGKRYKGPTVISARPSAGQPLWFELSK